MKKILLLKLFIFIASSTGIGIFGFFTYKHVSAQEIGLVSQTNQTNPSLNTPSVTNETGSEIIILLRNLSSIVLDDSIFSNPSFTRLKNQVVGLPVITVQGRRNPFAPSGNTASLVPQPEIITPGSSSSF